MRSSCQCFAGVLVLSLVGFLSLPLAFAGEDHGAIPSGLVEQSPPMAVAELATDEEPSAPTGSPETSSSGPVYGTIVKLKNSNAIIKLTAPNVQIGKTYQLVADSYAQKDFRPRHHGISWLYRNSSIALDNAGSFDIGRTLISYHYNIGYYEFGGYLSNDSLKNITGKLSIPEYGVGARVNALPNDPDHDVVPYAGLYLTVLSLTESNFSINAQGVGFRIGAQWFPFHELFALDAYYSWAQVSGDYQGTSFKLKPSGINIGWSIYF